MATARVASILDERPELTELHAHVGGAVDPAIMWSIAHQAGHPAAHARITGSLSN